jgi:NitT/TauT family transport system substrate-binding protein
MALMGRLMLLAATLAVLATPAGARAAEPEKKQLTMAIAGTSSQIYFLAINVAKAKGYFKAEGLDVDTVDFAGGAKALAALVGGRADIDAGSYEHAIQMQSKGQDVKCVALFGRSVGTVLAIGKHKAASFKSLKDLKGMRVGVSSPGFSATNIYLNLILARNGMKPSDVSVVGVGNGSVAYAAIQNGKIDAISSVDPVISQLSADGLIKIVVDSRTDEGLEAAYGGEYPSGCLLTTAGFMKDNPNTVQALANAIVRADKWIQAAGPGEIIKAVPESYLLGDRAVYIDAFLAAKGALSPDGMFPDAGAETARRALASIDAEIGKATIDLKAVYTNDFVKAANAKYPKG